MHSAKEKLSNVASAAKEHVNICTAKVEEKAEKAAARTEKEKKIAVERRKAKEAEAKMELHQAKARHAAENQPVVGGTYGQQPVGTAAPMAGATAPTYPLGGHRPGHKYM
ncbi:hypothetical protein F2P56_004368 [Juglans regia]|uniref:Late embryogenesis abundant protein 6-like n=2 Tax=Juglans regia TaxID=51240 RepID=A0A833XU26_JUGRE|nr:late embryogenesis abundant protein 6 [Juglans regia]KAF5477752.1 hypothetical protein F2P56_004368 [Juglans regia]